MAKTDWIALQAEFTKEHMRTGISAQDWCEKKGINYASARRYIKPHQIKAAQKAAESCAPKCAKDAKGRVRKIKRSKLRKKPEVTEGDKIEGEITNHANHHSDNSQSEENNSGRDGSGRFVPGNSLSRGNAGNPFPSNSIKPGERRALKHGGYAKYLKADEYFEDARQMTLQDELDFARARTISLTKTMESLAEIAHDKANDPDTRMDAINKMLSAEAALDRNIRTIESVERTIDQLFVSTVNVPRLKADTQRIIAATHKLKAETDRMTSEGRGVVTPMTDVLEDILTMGNDGMLS